MTFNGGMMRTARGAIALVVTVVLLGGFTEMAIGDAGCTKGFPWATFQRAFEGRTFIARTYLHPSIVPINPNKRKDPSHGYLVRKDAAYESPEVRLAPGRYAIVWSGPLGLGEYTISVVDERGSVLSSARGGAPPSDLMANPPRFEWSVHRPTTVRIRAVGAMGVLERAVSMFQLEVHWDTLKAYYDALHARKTTREGLDVLRQTLAYIRYIPSAYGDIEAAGVRSCKGVRITGEAAPGINVAEIFYEFDCAAYIEDIVDQELR